MNLLEYRRKHIPDNSNLFVSFSGGRTSALMSYFIKKSPIFEGINAVFAFSNTGEELKETLEFVRKCDEAWGLGVNYIEAKINKEKGKGTDFKIIKFEDLSTDGEPFSDMIDVYGLPNKFAPVCTDQLKTVPLKKFGDSIFGRGNYNTAVGIRADERNRINRKTACKKRFVYPLADIFPVDEKFVRQWWDSQDFDLGILDYQGNCKFCWKKSLRKRLTIARDNPEHLKNYLKWEKVSEYTFDRDNIPVEKILEMSKRKFRSAKDKHELRKTQCEIEVFDDIYLDLGSSCMCI